VSAEEFIRYLSSLVGLVGLAVLATTLGSMFGLWAAGATLFVAGFAIGVPLWNRHFEYSKDAREAMRLRPEQAPPAKEESPY
jgi:positive regulator of sigma E activity